LNEILLSLHSKMLDGIRSSVKKEFEVICQERTVTQKLRELEHLNNSQPLLLNGKRCPPLPAVPVASRLKEQVISSKVEMRDHLRKTLESHEKEYEDAQNSIVDKENQINKAVNDILQLCDISSSLRVSDQWSKIQKSESLDTNNK